MFICLILLTCSRAPGWGPDPASLPAARKDMLPVPSLTLFLLSLLVVVEVITAVVVFGQGFLNLVLTVLLAFFKMHLFNYY